MSFINLVFIAFAMSTDAFAAAISKGSSLPSPRLPNALKLGLLFGVIEGITPVIGWLIGSAGASYIEQYDHWIAFLLLLVLGGHMIYASFHGEDDEHEAQQTPKTSMLSYALTAFGTSIDAMTVGVSLAFLDVSILLAAAMIGLATFTMVTIGALLGERLGHLVGERAEALGGCVLIAIGSWILYTHLAAI